MAPATFHLIKVNDDAAFIAAVEKLPASDRPIYIGKCQHWIHAPKLSVPALTGAGDEFLGWDYLFIHRAESHETVALPTALKSLAERTWSITAESMDEMLASYDEAEAKRRSTPAPSLPAGWSASNDSGLKASVPPPDLEASLGLQAHALGSQRTSEPVVLKDFIGEFGKTYSGPVGMLNLISCNTGKRDQIYAYMAAFQASVGSKYGGELQVPGLGVTEWSSRKDEGELTVNEAVEGGKQAGWEDVGVVYYPSIWHFGKLLDDEEYFKADRQYKQGVLRDNPILCVTPVDITYSS